MTAPANFPLTLYRGDTYRWEFRTWEDAAKTIPFDLTGVVAKAEIRDQPGGLTIVPLDCQVTLPNIIAVALLLDAARLVPTRGVWDLQLTFASGDVNTIVAGAVTQTPDVTDSTLTALAAEPVVALRPVSPASPASPLRIRGVS